MINPIELLKNQGFTLVLAKNDQIISSVERGVAPLLKLIDEGVDCAGFFAVDKVVGRGAALLYAHMKVAKIYALIMSQSALDVLNEHGLDVEYEKLVPFIVNRKGDGICPMESAVKNTSDPQTAITLIKSKLKELSAHDYR